MKTILCLFFLSISTFLVGGCVTTKLDGLGIKSQLDWEKNELQTNEGDSGACTIGKPATNQGMSLCYELYVSEQYRIEVESQLRKTRIEPYDYTQIALGVLSAGAVAASSHISLLETLGISLATVVGLKTYANVPGSRSARQAAIEGLSCISSTTGHLLWDDRWFFAMRRYRYALHSAVSDSAPYINRVTNSDRLKDYTTLKTAAINSISLADNALIQYAALGKRVSLQRSKTLTDMHDLIDSSRGDVSTIVNSIIAAKAIQQTSNQQVDIVAENAAAAAADATPETPAAAVAQESLEVSILGTQMSSINNNDPKPLVETEGEDGNKKGGNEVLNDEGKKNFKDDVDAYSMPVLVNKIVNTNNTGSKDKLDAYMGIISSSIQGIATIAPRYLKTTNDLAACVIK